jgi:hypothetical protein
MRMTKSMQAVGRLFGGRFHDRSLAHSCFLLRHRLLALQPATFAVAAFRIT